MTLVLGGAVVAAVALAVATSRTPRDARVRSEDPPLAAALPAEPAQGLLGEAEDPPAAAGTALTGEVLEVLPVSKYTYLRLSTSSGEVWAAVPLTPIAVGSHVAVEGATLMTDFESATLKRTFKAIYFGNIAEPSSDVPGATDERTLPPGHPDISGVEARQIE